MKNTELTQMDSDLLKYPFSICINYNESFDFQGESQSPLFLGTVG